MTEAERRLWSLLRGHQMAGYKFRRQHPVGPYILDFACVRLKLAVEADGGQHADNAHDAFRTAWLEARGWRVVRFWNREIMGETESVLATLLAVVDGAL
jgi:very-short-patch-repair endonuclease